MLWRFFNNYWAIVALVDMIYNQWIAIDCFFPAVLLNFISIFYYKKGGGPCLLLIRQCNHTFVRDGSQINRCTLYVYLKNNASQYTTLLGTDILVKHVKQTINSSVAAIYWLTLPLNDFWLRVSNNRYWNSPIPKIITKQIKKKRN